MQLILENTTQNQSSNLFSPLACSLLTVSTPLACSYQRNHPPAMQTRSDSTRKNGISLMLVLLISTSVLLFMYYYIFVHLYKYINYFCATDTLFV